MKNSNIGGIVAAVVATLGLGATYNALSSSHSTPGAAAPVAFTGAKTPATVVPQGTGSKSFVVMSAKNLGAVCVLNSKASYKDPTNEVIVFSPTVAPQYASPEILVGKTVTASGNLQSRNGTSQVQVTDPAAIKVH